MLRLAFVVLAVAGLSASAPAMAQQRFVLSAKSFGPIEFTTSGQNVTGIYPQQKGRLYGRFIAPGTVQGQWFEPKSDKPCMTVRGGTTAWGNLVITNYGTRGMSGYWGYCDEKPNRAFNFH